MKRQGRKRVVILNFLKRQRKRHEALGKQQQAVADTMKVLRTNYLNTFTPEVVELLKTLLWRPKPGYHRSRWIAVLPKDAILLKILKTMHDCDERWSSNRGDYTFTHGVTEFRVEVNQYHGKMQVSVKFDFLESIGAKIHYDEKKELTKIRKLAKEKQLSCAEVEQALALLARKDD